MTAMFNKQSKVLLRRRGGLGPPACRGLPLHRYGRAAHRRPYNGMRGFILARGYLSCRRIVRIRLFRKQLPRGCAVPGMGNGSCPQVARTKKEFPASVHDPAALGATTSSVFSPNCKQFEENPPSPEGEGKALTKHFFVSCPQVCAVPKILSDF